MNSRSRSSTAAFLAIVVISILSAVASSVVRAQGADVAPFGWHAHALQSRDA